MELISPLIPLLIMLYGFIYLYVNRKKENVDSKIKVGFLCYNCKNPTTNEDYFNYINGRIEHDNPFQEELKICTKCNRDVKLHKFTSGYKYKMYVSKFNKIIFGTKSYRNLYLITFGIYMVFLISYILSMVLLDEKLTILSYIYNGILTIYWLILIYKAKVSIKKPSK